jgi:hypothetical protein
VFWGASGRDEGSVAVFSVSFGRECIPERIFSRGGDGAIVSAPRQRQAKLAPWAVVKNLVLGRNSNSAQCCFPAIQLFLCAYSSRLKRVPCPGTRVNDAEGQFQGPNIRVDVEGRDCVDIAMAKLKTPYFSPSGTIDEVLFKVDRRGNEG